MSKMKKVFFTLLAVCLFLNIGFIQNESGAALVETNLESIEKLPIEGNLDSIQINLGSGNISDVEGFWNKCKNHKVSKKYVPINFLVGPIIEDNSNEKYNHFIYEYCPNCNYIKKIGEGPHKYKADTINSVALCECGYKCFHDFSEVLCGKTALCKYCSTKLSRAHGLKTSTYIEKTASEHVKVVTCITCNLKKCITEKHEFNSANICECGYQYTKVCTHDYEAATCMLPKTCKKCKKTEGKALGHSYEITEYLFATNEAHIKVKLCKRCSDKIEELEKHNFTKNKCKNCGYSKECTHEYTEATCLNPKTCKICKKTVGKALGHKYTKATCTEPKQCIRCKVTEGNALGHSYKVKYTPVTSENHIELKECKKCSKKIEELKKHDFYSNNKCVYCKYENLCNHEYIPATCANPKTCKVCGQTEGTVAAHNYFDATCTRPKTCKVCGKTKGSVAAHNYQAATCIKPKTCKYCGKTEGQPLGHKIIGNKCIRCNTSQVIKD